MKKMRWTVYDREDKDGWTLKQFRRFSKAHRFAEELRSKGTNAAIMPLEGWK